jgi:hypothetical protein
MMSSWPPSHFLLAIALLLLGIDQIRMAIVDLRQIAQVTAQLTTPDPRLDRFRWVTYSTIGLEILGFGLAFWHLGWGAIVVLLSQVWFNLLAGVQLQPDGEPLTQDALIKNLGWRDRGIILVADGLGILLSGFWAIGWAPLGMAIGLLAMVLIYGVIKYS